MTHGEWIHHHSAIGDHRVTDRRRGERSPMNLVEKPAMNCMCSIVARCKYYGRGSTRRDPPTEGRRVRADRDRSIAQRPPCPDRIGAWAVASGHGPSFARSGEVGRVHPPLSGSVPLKASPTARGYGADWQRLRKVILIRDGYRCHWCGAVATEVDHVRPLVFGGPRLEPTNLVAACKRCNARRGQAVRGKANRAGLEPGSGFLCGCADR